MTFVRTRWSALGAAVAVALGGGGIAMVSATTPADAVTFVPITPCRVMDTRLAPDNVGSRSAPLGTDETYTVDAVAATDAAGECAGIIPTSATAISMNVTTTDATAGTFLTIWEADVAPRPTASSLNPQPGQAATPNAVTTGLNPDGEFSIYNLDGTVNVLADINGYYTDHHHDDRYYTKGQVDAAIAARHPVTSVVSVDAGAFDHFIDDGASLIHTGNGVNVESSLTSFLLAPVSLPHGASVTDVDVTLRDNDVSDNLFVKLQCRDDTPTVATRWSGSTTGAEPGFQVLSLKPTGRNISIDNSACAYFLEVGGDNWTGGSRRLAKVTITLRLPN